MRLRDKIFHYLLECYTQPLRFQDQVQIEDFFMNVYICHDTFNYPDLGQKTLRVKYNIH